MKKCIILFVFVSFCSFSFQLKAQFAGYKGKHFMIGYNMGVCTPIFLYLDEEEPSADFFAFSHGLHAEYIITRKGVLGAYGNYMKHKFAEYENAVLDEYNNVYFEHTVRNLTAYSFGITYKMYNPTSNLIAPIGSYGGVSLFLMGLNQEKITAKEKTISNNFITPGIGFLFGQSRIIFNTIVLDGGIDINIPVRALSIFEMNTDERFENDRFNKNIGFAYLINYSTGVHLSVKGILF